MKQNLENSIKESLKEFELPYDPAAWNAMSKKLDQQLPSSPKSNWKWYLGGAATVAIIAVVVTFWTNETSNNKKEAQTALTNTDVESKTKESSTSSENVGNTTEQDAVSSSGNDESNSVVTPSENPIEKSSNSSANTANSNVEKPVNTNNSNNDSFNNQLNPEKTSGSGNGNVTKEIFVPSINNACIGDVASIENKNDVSLIVKDPNGEKTTIKAKKSIDFTASTDGIHTIGYLENGTFIAKESFLVLASPKSDFTIDDQNKYENGIPSIDLKATSIGASYTWNFEKQSGTVSGKEISVHYFNKGDYKISLTVMGTNGCKATESKSIQIEDDYNLLAVTAFDPMSNDIRKNTFVPYALTQRSVDFNMIVIDPKDGAIIFETNDATKPWTGLDRRNGQMVEPNKTYIWKVVLENPVKGEPREYKGTIIRL